MTRIFPYLFLRTNQYIYLVPIIITKILCSQSEQKSKHMQGNIPTRINN